MEKVIRERDIERAFVRRVKALSGEVRKVKWIGRRHAPDRVAFLPGVGRPLWVELKAPGKKLRAGQEREIARLRCLGQIVLVISTLDEARTVMLPL